MALSLTFLGRSCDRWRVRVASDPPEKLRGLTVQLTCERGKPLGRAVVAPDNAGSCWVAELCGPPQLPPGTVVRAVAEADGGVEEAQIGVDNRRGLHAFLHADARLPLDSDPKGSSLSPKEAKRLGSIFPWVCGCEKKDDDDDIEAMLREMDIDPADLDAALLGGLRK